MKPFIHDNFLLSSKQAERLYHDYAADEPILDYHCHLSPGDIAENRRFANLHEIWLAGDHYKWRAMRTNGVDERYCAGDASPKDKFLAWAKTVPHTLRNPLYHWSHLELKRYFDIDDLLNENTAHDIWDRANERLADEDLRTWGILEKFNVRCVCTTDDPANALRHHQATADALLRTKVYPTFRPDEVFTLTDAQRFTAWLDRLAAVSGTDIISLPGLLSALDKRHADFHALGCRLSDHGLSYCFCESCPEAEATKTFDRARARGQVTPEAANRFGGFMMEFFARLDASRGWTKQLHLGAMRNNNTRMLNAVGPDTGFDSIGDWPQAEALARCLDQLDQRDALPRIVLYNLNPADNYVFSAMIGNFQDGRSAGKIQLGAAWWFLDQLDGMRWQINALSNLGLLSRFIGMLTDSRSFMSFPRHEYFRRLLCDLLGQDMKAGLMPDDIELAGRLVRRICYANARDYLQLNLD